MNTEDLDDTIEIDLSSTEEFHDEVSNEPPADRLRILEALLFASDEILTSSRLKTILPDNPDARQIRKMVEKINTTLQKERHPFEIVEIGGGYQFRTVSYYHPWVRQIFKEKAAKKLSIQALECLAIIAYKQPLSKAEIEAIRGVVSDGAMKTLLERRLVTITGRSDKPGRPLQYGTTHEFLKYFGLNKIDDLPRIEEFEAIAREKINDLSMDKLQGERQPMSDEESPINDTEVLSISSIAPDSLDSPGGEQNDPGCEATHDDPGSEAKQYDHKSKAKKGNHSFEAKHDDYSFEAKHDDYSSDETQKDFSFKDMQDDYSSDETQKDLSPSDIHKGFCSDETQKDLSLGDIHKEFSTLSKQNEFTRVFAYDDGITDEEMSETKIQVRMEDLYKREILETSRIQESARNTDSGQQVISSENNNDDNEEVLEVFLPPPKIDNEENDE